MPGEGPYLDLCAGTLELSLTLLKQKNVGSWITAIDFCPAMLLKGKKKLTNHYQNTVQTASIKIVVGDGEYLPLKEDTYQGIMIGFGLRNLRDRWAGLKEAIRVLKPGGRLVVLEFSAPTAPLFRPLYYFYFCHVLTPLGNLFSRAYMPFSHLRDSVLTFPNKNELASMMLDVGFVKVSYQLLTFGIVALHCGEKPSQE
jgi:demethylmenaquinone methyltransferase/2-methoxy-6-polyprenyl-1,4-benzoquinol methylase